MTCLANNDSLFDLFDVANLGIYGFRGEIQMTEQPRFASTTARLAPAYALELPARPEEDGERWDGQS